MSFGDARGTLGIRMSLILKKVDYIHVCMYTIRQEDHGSFTILQNIHPRSSIVIFFTWPL